MGSCLAPHGDLFCLQGNRVAEWVSHSVGLPQYVQAFRDNSITVGGADLWGGVYHTLIACTMLMHGACMRRFWTFRCL